MTAIIKTEITDKDGKLWPQILAIYMVALGPFTTGILYAWSSPFALVIAQDKVNYNITEQETSQFMVYQPIGMIVGSLSFLYIAEWLGRKKSILFLVVPQVMTWIVTIVATTKWHFYISRLIAGLGDAVMFLSVTPYIGEIASPTVRGYFGNIPTFAMYGGQFFITAIGSYLDVRTSSYICIGIPIIFALLVWLLPESPYQLIKSGHMEEAKKSIQWFRRIQNVEATFLQIKADVERQISESGTWKDLFTIESNRKALRAGVFLRISQQFAGMSTFSTYTQLVFSKAGGNFSPQTCSMIFIGNVCILNSVCSFSVERFGRKPSYFYSLLCTGSVLLAMSIYFFIEQYRWADLDSFSWFPLGGMLVYVIMYSFGLGVIPTLMLSELFSESVKGKGLALVSVIFAIAVFISTNLFHFLNSCIGLYSPFLFYCMMCYFSSILSMKWVPETKGKTLEQIQQELKADENKSIH